MAETSESTELAPERARELAREGAAVIDVRGADEHEAGHISGDVLITFDRLGAEAATLSRDAPLVVYCRSGDRSAAAAQALRASGYVAYSIEGGLLGWTESGLPIEPEDGRVADRNVLPPS